MKRKPNLIGGIVLAVLVFFSTLTPDLEAQAAPPPPTGQELDQLLAPIALYPDPLLAQITTASTNPQEILDVDNWLRQNSGLNGSALTNAAQMQGFDPAFVALVNFPQVLDMMAQNIDDYAAIGEAFSANQASVTDSIQRLRAQAYQAGSLRSTPQQQVQVQQAGAQPIYAIQPVNPQVVYVPQYDPTVVYAPGPGIAAGALIGFGVGIGIGALLVGGAPWAWGGWGWNWGGRRVYYNHAYWGGWHGGYRSPRGFYRPRPVVYANRPGFRGNWHYRPTGYRPPMVRPGPGGRPGPGARPGAPRPGYRPGAGNRPAARPGGPGPARPGTGARPGVQPGGNRPNANRPAARPSNPNSGARPGGQPGGNRPAAPQQNRQQNRPSAPAGRQENRPSGGNRDEGRGRG